MNPNWFNMICLIWYDRKPNAVPSNTSPIAATSDATHAWHCWLRWLADTPPDLLCHLAGSEHPNNPLCMPSGQAVFQRGFRECRRSFALWRREFTRDRSRGVGREMTVSFVFNPAARAQINEGFREYLARDERDLRRITEWCDLSQFEPLWEFNIWVRENRWFT